MIFNIDLLDGKPPISLVLKEEDAERLREFLDGCFSLEERLQQAEDELFDARSKYAKLLEDFSNV